jgi:hypothetical protein
MLYNCTSLVQISFEGPNELGTVGPVQFKRGDYLKYMLEMKAFY